MNRVRACLVAPRRRFAAALLAACLSACITSEPEPAQVRANAGLYTPGSQLGVVPSNEPKGYGTDMQRGPASDGCNTNFGPPGTVGTLTVNFTTEVVGQAWQPANVGAVWIERVDPDNPDDIGKDRFVRTLEYWADIRIESLETWTSRTCSSVMEVDAMSNATLSDHNTPHMAMWDGKDIYGQTVPDGPYRLNIEITEYEEQGPRNYYKFTKGPGPDTQRPADEPPVKGLVMMYATGMGSALGP